MGAREVRARRLWALSPSLAWSQQTTGRARGLTRSKRLPTPLASRRGRASGVNRVMVVDCVCVCRVVCLAQTNLRILAFPYPPCEKDVLRTPKHCGARAGRLSVLPLPRQSEHTVRCGSALRLSALCCANELRLRVWVREDANLRVLFERD